ncbi:MAG: bifunctional 2-C-methyl-D-erythritol 4-phosphate cytidylyltransferase/2-C-methyl-D-erythritol 2,4-cyclodiphosphate synthase [Hoeflea sp.]|uniref:bifunctional 2-C-methyl-D-erythritol 4-phosphate cytidylyltransferase/2-C-methyl-D-erythritol 2,4-cyclodiphosphate synthase n=1 Tax=Hoeflea sp. TaxID=1940281 RepID=UPI001DD99E1A|nr:bifunctional 2-C-methyl-D-erythritol 4-phosphate cytidylyltransferase/2-C-methyl-D-erythritol 2,4-cyclodiphosphate synthase [Hoeflea sp.]MBU4529454.1 bifunctional 2-C-methyl-D-erythritol 4-phosphate cytidylyltransferase/2-C-methyl-D-erythritol 2,4-cyclodiphosphate synthase [Alphaproteobacteria bacterium]MBU4546573.1 bifunctional 2-C-methyl-D-erythritol 4-phosphate cytidylyltransferase/2-C-methyl-D-erythritol 2,4-cyclodiphosphate synthase [Alphaproteobacteria bacterium]MBU4550841.1 bifunctiona
MNTAQKFGLVIVAAGRGERAGSPADGPKQYRQIGGRPVIAHTLATFLSHPSCGEIVVVIHADDEALYASATAGIAGADRVRTVSGGANRQASVRAGLEAMAETAPNHVLIHDAVRPFVTLEIIDGVLEAHNAGSLAALPAVAVADTLKRGDAHGDVTGTVPRDGLFAAQTPQGFDFAAISAAHAKAAAESDTSFTDDCAIAEWAGLSVRLTPGHPSNVKLTTAEDIAMANERLSPAPLPDVRTGNGYDVHRLVPGDHVTLCGVEIPHDQRLDGHSDADVGLHALTDALLATCGAGDIGDHFPPSDPQWRGAASEIFLAHAAKIVREAGGVIMNADVTIIAEAPKIGPHRQAMRAALSRILEISIDRCSVKATTNETIGFAGRREGIASIATATVVFGERT